MKPSRGLELRLRRAFRNRIAQPTTRLQNRLRYSGRKVECPCCGVRLRSFMPFKGRIEAMCPWCGSLERHRLLSIFIARREYLRAGTRVLHFAPEDALKRALDVRGVDYLSVDLTSKAADVNADITALPFADDSFDLVVCSHVLEHVDDDHQAMRELARVTRDDGRLLVMCPVDPQRQVTYEDPSVTERLAAFGQDDHVRLYGTDIARRLTDAGLDVELCSLDAVASQEEVEHFALRRRDSWGPDSIYDCTVRAKSAAPVGRSSP